MPETRDKFDRLKCPVINCSHYISALTGLDELHKLQKHMKRKHGQTIDLFEAMDLRQLHGG